MIKFTNSDVVDKLKEKEKLYLKLSNKSLEEEYIEMLNDADTLKDMLDQRRAKSWVEISELEERLNALREEERKLTIILKEYTCFFIALTVAISHVLDVRL